MGHRHQFGGMGVNHGFLIAALAEQVIVDRKVRRQFRCGMNILFGHDRIATAVVGDTDDRHIVHRRGRDIAHSAVSTGHQEKMTAQVFNRTRQGDGFTQRSQGPDRIVDHIGDIVRNIAAVTFGPAFLPKVSGHFGHFGDTFRQLFVVFHDLQILKQRREKDREKQNRETQHQHRDRPHTAPLPFFEGNPPEIGKQYIERHEDTPRKRQQDGRARKETPSHFKPEKLRIPQHTGQCAEEQVHGKLTAFHGKIFTARMVLQVLAQAVNRVGEEATECHEQNHRQSGIEDIGSCGLHGCTNRRTGIKPQREAGAHDAGQQGHQQTFRQGEVADGGPLLLLAHIACAQRPRITDHGDAGQRDAYTRQQQQSVTVEQIRPGEQRGQERPERRAGPQRHRLPERYA